MPTIQRANTNIPTIMMAERIAELVQTKALPAEQEYA
jgi:hypothetical protein